MRQDPADHLFLAGRQINLSRTQQGVSEDELHIGQRQRRILGYPVGRGVTQVAQGPVGAQRASRTAEHRPGRWIGQRPPRAAQRQPQRIVPTHRCHVGQRRLIQPQPHEGIWGCWQLLQRTTSLADHRDQLLTRIDVTLSDPEQLRGPRPGRDP